MRSCSSPPPSRLSSDMWRHAVLPGQRKRRAGYWWHLSRSGCRLPRPLGECGSICSRELRRSSKFIGGGNAESWLWPRRIALQDLRALVSGTITLLACIILRSGSGRAALDLGAVSPLLGLSVDGTGGGGLSGASRRLLPCCRHLRQRSRRCTPLRQPAAVDGFPGPRTLERSTGETVKRGGLTLAGNRRARRVLVEGAWSYRHLARVTETIRVRLRVCRRRCGRSPGKRRHGCAALTGA